MHDEKIYEVEPKTTDRVQDEPWYSDYQAVCEVLCSGPNPELEGPHFYERLPDGLERALSACKVYFETYPGPPGWMPPDDARLLRWIGTAWLTEEQMLKIEQYES